MSGGALGGRAAGTAPGACLLLLLLPLLCALLLDVASRDPFCPRCLHCLPRSRATSSLLDGAQSHKVSADSDDVNMLLRFYYSFPYALFFICVFNEACLLALYLLHFT